MSIKDSLKGFIDNTGLAELFNRPAWNEEAARKPLLKGIETAKRQFEAGQTTAPNRWWRASNGVVALTVKVKGDTLDINGHSTNHIPQERFSEFLDQLKAAVEAGEFDEELKNHGNGDAQVRIPKASKASGGTRNVGEQSKLNIGVAAKRRATPPPSWDAIRKSYVDGGADPAMVDIAIKKRQAAEKA